MLVARLLASDFPSKNPRTQTRTILIHKRYAQSEKTNYQCQNKR